MHGRKCALSCPQAHESLDQPGRDYHGTATQYLCSFHGRSALQPDCGRRIREVQQLTYFSPSPISPKYSDFRKAGGSLPGAEIEFEKATFAIARTLQMPGKPIISACTGLPLRPLKECTRLASYVRGSYDNSTAAVLVITDIFFLEKKVLTSSFKPIQPRNLTSTSPKPRAALY